VGAVRSRSLHMPPSAALSDARNPLRRNSVYAGCGGMRERTFSNRSDVGLGEGGFTRSFAPRHDRRVYPRRVCRPLSLVAVPNPVRRIIARGCPAKVAWSVIGLNTVTMGNLPALARARSVKLLTNKEMNADLFSRSIARVKQNGWVPIPIDDISQNVANSTRRVVASAWKNSLHPALVRHRVSGAAGNGFPSLFHKRAIAQTKHCDNRKGRTCG
jgi:hypothetical protein